ncbi:MAG: hypothetical protein WKF84_29690 [Pyrinomonadaceae bacterium]
MAKSSTTEVIERDDASSESGSADLQQEEHQQRKEEQKDRVEQVDRETLLKMLRQMVLVRRFEGKGG